MSTTAMHTTANPEVIPRRAVIVGGGVLAATLLGAAAVRLSGYQSGQPDAPAVAQRELIFRDRADGGIDIVDAHSSALVDSAHGEQGFLRGTLRGLVRERKRLGLPTDTPLQLIGRADGRLTLADPATGQRIDLEAFGPTNAAVFARWLPIR